jgi:hypothetical protein
MASAAASPGTPSPAAARAATAASALVSPKASRSTAGGAQVEEGTQALGPQALVVEGGAQELGLGHQALVGHHGAGRERRRARRELVAPRVALEVAGHAARVDADLHDPAGAARPDHAEHGGGAAEQAREVGQDPVLVVAGDGGPQAPPAATGSHRHAVLLDDPRRTLDGA